MSKIKMNLSKTSHYENMTADVPIIKERFISDYLEKQISRFSSAFPVFIDAQTGSGKNTFIEKHLIKYADENEKTILILSNRIAVDIAQKKRIAREIGCINELELKYKENGWKVDVNEIGNVMIMTYQQFLNDRTVLKKHFDYVVADECHYFWTDSAFSNSTERVLNKIIFNFESSVRIYMTSTPDNIFPIIKDKEGVNKRIRPFEDTMLVSEDYICLSDKACTKFYYNKFIKTFKNANFYMCKAVEDCKFKVNKNLYQFYKFDRDYNYIDKIIPFTKTEELVELINNSENKRKWVVFVDNNDLGNQLQVKIPNSIFINAQKRYCDDEATECFSDLTSTEKFDQRVLISTSVIDNGINLKNSEIREVVICADSMETFIQMLGRIRITNKNHKLNLYIKSYSISTLKSRIKVCKKSLEAMEYLDKYGYDFFNMKYYDSKELFEIANTLFYHKKEGKIEFNKIGLAFRKHKIEELQDIIKYIENENSDINSFESYVCKNWLKVSTDLICLLDKKEELIKFLEEHLGKTITNEKIDKFREDITEIMLKTLKKEGSLRANRTLDYNAINGILVKNGIQYKISVTNKNWQVERINVNNLEVE